MANEIQEFCPKCKSKLTTPTIDGFTVCTNRRRCDWTSDDVLGTLPHLVLPPNCDVYLGAEREILDGDGPSKDGLGEILD